MRATPRGRNLSAERAAGAGGPQSGARLVGGARPLRERERERGVGLEAQWRGESLAHDLCVHEQAVARAKDVGEQPAVVVAGLDVTLQPHRGAAWQERRGEAGRLGAEALRGLSEVFDL